MNADSTCPPLLIIGGTTEGRIAVEVCDESGKPYFYSTKGAAQQVESKHGVRLTGGLDAEGMADFCSRERVRLIVDAAHPFAMEVHRNVGRVAEQLGMPVVRFERQFPPLPPHVRVFESYQELIQGLFSGSFDRVLALTGVNTIAPLKEYWQKREMYFRIMQRDESLAMVRKNNFPLSQIIFYDEDKSEDEYAMYRSLAPDALVTKESGVSGGFLEKVVWAEKLGIPLFVVSRPPLPYTPSEVVVGKFGIRRAIEKLLPPFFDLKTGYTTGSTATAAASAALFSLLTGEMPSEYTITLPNGEPLSIPIAHIRNNPDGTVTAMAHKYAGDDPDVTHGIEIEATVEYTHESQEVTFEGGEGVGRVTLPGLGIALGEAAINPTPRAMMTREALQLLNRWCEDADRGVRITISVPRGRELAAKTFNPKIGVVNGISIIGTSGIVRPFSSEAFVGAIRAEVRVARSLGIEHVVFNSGAKSERFLKSRYPDLPSQAFIQYGNFVGEALQEAEGVGFRKVTIGIMIGKAVKLAEGLLDTHSHKAVMNRTFIAGMAREAGAESDILQAIEQMNMAREIWGFIPQREHPFYQILLHKCHETISSLLRAEEPEVILISDEGEIVTLS